METNTETTDIFDMLRTINKNQNRYLVEGKFKDWGFTRELQDSFDYFKYKFMKLIEINMNSFTYEKLKTALDYFNESQLLTEYNNTKWYNGSLLIIDDNMSDLDYKCFGMYYTLREIFKHQ